MFCYYIGNMYNIHYLFPYQVYDKKIYLYQLYFYFLIYYQCYLFVYFLNLYLLLCYKFYHFQLHFNVNIYIRLHLQYKNTINNGIILKYIYIQNYIYIIYKLIKLSYNYFYTNGVPTEEADLIKYINMDSLTNDNKYFSKKVHYFCVLLININKNKVLI